MGLTPAGPVTRAPRTRLAQLPGALLALGACAYMGRLGLLNPEALAAPYLSLSVLAIGLAIGWARPLAPLRLRVRRALYHSRRTRFYAFLFTAATVAYATLAWTLFNGVPHLDDEVSALFQARLFLQGRITMPAPALWEFFYCHLVLDPRFDLDHFCSMYPPGHPLLLAPGALLHASWLVTPLLGAGTVVMVAALARQLFGSRVGRTAGLLALASPLLASLSATHLSHVPTAFLCTLAMWSVCRWLRTGKTRFGMAAGCALGLALLCRPLTAAIVGTCIGAAALWYWRRALAAWRGALAAVLAVSCAAGLLLLYQKATTGDYFTAGHELGLGRRGQFGFVYLDWARTHTVAQGVIYTGMRLRALNESLLGWPIPALCLALLPFLLFRGRKEHTWLLLPALGLLGAYLAYWYYEVFHPARYIFSAVPMLLVLAAAGLHALHQRLRDGSRSPTVRGLPTALVAACLCFEVFVYLPGYFARFPDNHGDVEAVLHRVVRDYHISNAVIFMDSIERMARDDPFNDYYATGFMRNNLGFNGDIIYARNLREKNHLLAAAHPGRNYYLYRYNRHLNRAHLYRMTFNGEEAFLESVPRTSRDIVPRPL